MDLSNVFQLNCWKKLHDTIITRNCSQYAFSVFSILFHELVACLLFFFFMKQSTDKEHTRKNTIRVRSVQNIRRFRCERKNLSSCILFWKNVSTIRIHYPYTLISQTKNWFNERVEMEHEPCIQNCIRLKHCKVRRMPLFVYVSVNRENMFQINVTDSSNTDTYFLCVQVQASNRGRKNPSNFQFTSSGGVWPVPITKVRVIIQIGLIYSWFKK